jgi:hypothetical protein
MNSYFLVNKENNKFKVVYRFLVYLIVYDYVWLKLRTLSLNINASKWWYGHDWNLENSWYYNYIDKKIPFIPWFIVFYAFVYFASYALLFVIFIYLIYFCVSLNSEKKREKKGVNWKAQKKNNWQHLTKLTYDFLLWLIMFSVLEFLIWIFFPIKYIKNEYLRWNDLDEGWIKNLFFTWHSSVDSKEPEFYMANSFPSNHFVIFLGISLFLFHLCRYNFFTNKNCKKFHKWSLLFMTLMSMIVCLLVSLSIFFTKKHYMIDSLATYVYGIAFWMLIRKKSSYLFRLFS